MFRELKYVIAVVDNGGITKAAESLFITQPSLSRYIQELEKTLGVQLFKRINNRLILTYAGEKYVETARSILAQYAKLEENLSNINEALTGRLRIGIASLRMSYSMPKILKAYMNKYPQVNIELFEFATKELEQMLLAGDIDLAVINFSEKSDKITYIPFFKENLLLSVPQSHPLSGKGVLREDCRYPWINLKLIHNQPFILLSHQQRLFDAAVKLFEQYRVTPRVVISTKSVESAFRLSEVGIGITLVPETFTRFCLTDTPPVLFSIGEPLITWSLGVAYCSGSYIPAVAKTFISVIREMYL